MKIRFGLRSLLIAVTAAGLLLGAGKLWYHLQEAEYLRQQAVVDRLQAAGSDVQWGQRCPTWLPWLARAPAFKRVTVVLGGNLNSVLDEIPNLPQVEEIVTTERKLSRSDLDRLARFDQITKVTIAYGPYTAERDKAPEDISPDEIDARLSQKIVVKLP
jgi:hypothetical protein